MRTLHWKGANAVPRNKRDACKLCLSCGIAWFADGTMKIVVVYKGSKSDAPFEEIDGVRYSVTKPMHCTTKT